MCKAITFVALGLLVGCAGPVVQVTVIDGISRKPLADVQVDYAGREDYTENRKECRVGITRSDGSVTISNYPYMDVNEFWFRKSGYAPGHVQWLRGDQEIGGLVSPCVDDPETVSGKMQGKAIKVTEPIKLDLFPYKIVAK